MDHIHHDRTYKKSRFQQELEQSVSRKLISSLLLGCLLFCIAIAVVNALNQNARREDHLESVASTFHEVYNNTSAFLLDAGHTELFLSELRKDQDNLRYLISQYNVSALVEIQLILTDSKGNVRFTTFSEGEMNLHRQEFNCIAVDNACHLMRTVYTTVYHFRANSSEYVMIHPLYRDGEYQGAAAVYLNENDWTKLFSQYQYDAILTKPNGDVIACSNSSFLSQKNANKYLPADAAQYVRVNGNRYLRSSRSLENGTVLAYSFIYSPTNYSYLFVGLLLIVLLGLGLALFCLRYTFRGEVWASFSANGHAYTDGVVRTGQVLDRNGTVLYDGPSGVYHEDSALRQATLHAVGDQLGNISTSALEAFQSRLIGFDPLTGTLSGGHKVYLTIDADLSRTAWEALDGRKGVAAVYNYQTGDILCMVSNPSFDPADPPEISDDDSNYEGVYLNRLLSGLYTPGSVFKVVTTAAALEQLPGVEERTFTCDGSVTIGDQVITCPYAHGEMDLSDAFARSCNGVYAQLAVELGANTLEKYAEKAGLTRSYDVNGIPTAVIIM